MSKIRVILLGASFARLVQAVGFQRHAGFEVVGIAGSDAAKARRVADELGIVNASGDWRQLIAEVEADLVSIVTPVDLHHPMMLSALAAGRHVLCEKPTALHRFQAIEMRDAARAAGRVAAINHEFRFFPARAAAVEIVRAGGIGTPRRAEILGRYP
ncbi:MAG: Gfo/Idh/MocA family oxidoreductase, partial [Candidatus Eisenbacteria bacterium]|nr:Gfo/Idh/MocA family oxidoreductase [Candidatus Eisenbacteria bacterium]